MYRPCYAPVFAPSSGLDCALIRLRMAILIALLLIVLAITFGSEGILCMIRKAAYRMRHCSEGNTDSTIDIGFSLDRWIRETPHVRSAIIWRPDGSRALRYGDWRREDKQLLARLYAELRDTSTAGITETPDIAGFRYFNEGRGESENRLMEIGYVIDIARRTFFAHVAQTLYVEITTQVPWRLSALSADHIAYLLDSRHMYTWSTHLDMHVLEVSQGKATPGDPGRIFQWLQANAIIQPTTRDTIIALLEWCRDLSHDGGILDGPDDETPDHWPGSRGSNQAHWQYEGYQPVERTIRGTIRERYTTASHWTHGCQGTTGFLRCLLRTVNIPVKREDGCGHAIPYFIADRVFISHGDDPYGRWMREYTPRIPMSEILIDDGSLEGFFANCDHVGRGVTMAIIRLLPDQLIDMRCRDRTSGVPLAEGEVYAFLTPDLSVADIERLRVIARLDEEIARRGGCDGLI